MSQPTYTELWGDHRKGVRMSEAHKEEETVLTVQQQQELREVHRKVKGSLLQLESLMTTLDIPYKSMYTSSIQY